MSLPAPIQFPVTGGKAVYLRASKELSGPQWDEMIVIFSLMRPVDQEDAETEPVVEWAAREQTGGDQR